MNAPLCENNLTSIQVICELLPFTIRHFYSELTIRTIRAKHPHHTCWIEIPQTPNTKTKQVYQKV